MARIRTIKPEFWTSEQVMNCSLSARLMFIGMWNFADDKGRMTLSEKKIKAQIFPSDDLSFMDIHGMLLELSKNDLVTLYDVDNVEYIQINGWKHQRIDKPQKSRYPNTQGSFDDDSQNGKRPLGVGMEWKGRDNQQR